MILDTSPRHSSSRNVLPCSFVLAGMLLGLCTLAASADVPDSYHKMWGDLRQRIDTNIERYRKADGTVELVDAQGNPVAGASLDIRQKTHAFHFGCNALVLGQLGERNEAYEKAFAKLFNLATTTFCWGAVEPKPGQLRFEEGSEEIWRRPPPARVVAFGKKYGLTLKGQPLLAGSWHPAWAPKDPEETKKLYKEWFAKVAKRFGDEYQIFDVVNESQCHRKFCLYTPELEYVGWAFTEAQSVFPAKTVLEINEATGFAHNGLPSEGKNVYYNQLKKLFEQGAGIDSIGFQFHMMSNGSLKAHLEGRLYDPESLLNLYDSFGEFGKRLYITEITIPTTLEPGEAGEAIQAEVIENLYRLWFSVPRMAGIIYWNLPDGAAWKNEGRVKAGLIDENFREKPAYKTLDRLINQQWRTNVTATTNDQGKADFRGFLGKYVVKVSRADRSQEFEVDLATDNPSPYRLVVER